jgi:hypothetical protein
MKLSRPYFALPFVLLSILFTTFIAAIFHKVAAITFLRLDAINFDHAAVSARNICLSAAVTHFLPTKLFDNNRGYSERYFDVGVMGERERTAAPIQQQNQK